MSPALTPIPSKYYGFTVRIQGVLVPLIARAEYRDPDGVEWGNCFSTDERSGIFCAIPPTGTALQPADGEDAILLIQLGKAVPSTFLTYLREIPAGLWQVIRSRRV